MASLFDQALQIADRINYQHNAITANFAFNNLTQNADIQVIFEKSKEIVDIQGETGVVTRRPMAFVEHKPLLEKSIPLPKVRDQLTIDSIVYDIVSAPDDGHNQTEMQLEKA